jgi:hypothetical protein
VTDLDDALVRAAGYDKRQDPYYTLIDSVLVTLSLWMTDLDDALVRAPGDGESQYPLQSAAFSDMKGRIPATI